MVPTWRPAIMATRAMPRRPPLPYHRGQRRSPVSRRGSTHDRRSTNTGTFATLTADRDPWASFVTYGLLDGAPVLCVSNIAEHGRNLAGDPAGQHRHRRAELRSRPARQWPRHAGRRCRTTRPATNAPPRAMRTWPPSPRRSTTSTTATSPCGCCGYSGCGGSADTAGWIRRRVRPTRRPSPTRCSRTRRGCDRAPQCRPRRRAASPWRKRSAATPTPRRAPCTGADRYGLDLKVTTATRSGLHPGRLWRADRFVRRISFGHGASWRGAPAGTEHAGPPRVVQYHRRYAARPASGHLASGLRSHPHPRPRASRASPSSWPAASSATTTSTASTPSTPGNGWRSSAGRLPIWRAATESSSTPSVVSPWAPTRWRTASRWSPARPGSPSARNRSSAAASSGSKAPGWNRAPGCCWSTT